MVMVMVVRGRCYGEERADLEDLLYTKDIAGWVVMTSQW